MGKVIQFAPTNYDRLDDFNKGVIRAGIGHAIAEYCNGDYMTFYNLLTAADKEK